MRVVVAVLGCMSVVASVASKDLEGWIDGAVVDGSLPCAVGLAERGGREIFFHVTGRRDPEREEAAAGRDTIFWVYSITKMFTAAGVLKLEEQGRLDLDRPVADYLPEWGRPRAWRGGEAAATDTVETRPVTVRHLLTHTAGLYYTHTAGPVLAAHMKAREMAAYAEPEEFLSFITALPLHDEPGARYRYSISYAVLGILIERVSGKALDEFLRDEFFVPLGMEDTGFRPNEAQRARLARICVAGVDGRATPDAASEARLPARGRFLAGGGDAFSTADDLVRFGRMLLRGGELDGVRVLAPETVARMRTDQLGPELRAGFRSRHPTADTYGLGVGVSTRDTADGAGRAGAFGWTGNATTILQIDPATSSVAVFLTQMRPPRAELYGEFLRGLTPLLLAEEANSRGVQP